MDKYMILAFMMDRQLKLEKQTKMMDRQLKLEKQTKDEVKGNVEQIQYKNVNQTIDEDTIMLLTL
jgi:hypothetical protein